MTRANLFAAIRPYAPDRRFSTAMVNHIDELADMMGMPREGGPLTVRGASELVGHEAIVCEAYKDSESIWTWGIGITASSGVDPLQYKDKPASIDTVLRAFIGRCNAIYIPDVLAAFSGRALNEAQFAAALSFHYNTGAIKKTDWVKLWLAGKAKDARAFLETHYLNGGTLTDRRKKEAALFFDGKWNGDGKATVLAVNKPSYTPKWSSAIRVDVMEPLTGIMGS